MWLLNNETAIRRYKPEHATLTGYHVTFQCTCNIKFELCLPLNFSRLSVKESKVLSFYTEVHNFGLSSILPTVFQIVTVVTWYFRGFSSCHVVSSLPDAFPGCLIQEKNVTIFWRVHKLTKSDYYFPYVCLSVHPSVRPSARNNSAPTGRIFMKFLYVTIFRKTVEKIQVTLNSDQYKTGTLHQNGTLHENGYFTRKRGCFTWKRVLYMKTSTLHENGYFTRKRVLYMKTGTLHENGVLYMKTGTLHENGYFTWKGYFTRERVFYMKTNINFLSYLANFFLDREMFQAKVVGRIKIHILFSITIFPKVVLFIR
jgi:hypothetical protein